MAGMVENRTTYVPLKPYLFYGEICYDCTRITTKQYYEIVLEKHLKKMVKFIEDKTEIENAVIPKPGRAVIFDGYIQK